MILDIDSHLPRALRGDLNRLNQILINLLANAIKFTEKGKVKMLVEQLERGISAVKVQFSVIDSGIGMEKDILDKIFSSFSQADTSTTREYGGTGLGLTISKQLIELMGGTISVESTPGQGSVFSFTLDMALGDETRVKSVVSSVLADRAPETGQDPTSLRGCRILLVEDNEINQQVVLEKLKKAGMIVDLAADGREAVNAVQVETYDAILMDIQMPVMDGYEASIAIRAQETGQLPGEGRRLPIIAITANAMAGDKAKSLEAGMDDYISKPIDTGLLYQTLLRWIKPEPCEADNAALAADRADETDVLPDFLPGLALDKGLKNLEGNIKLYKKLLFSFLRDHEEAADRISTALAENDRDTAHLLSHTIKGVAGNLGAFDLQKAASLLEEAVVLNVGSGPADLLHDFKGQLQVVMESIRTLPQQEEEQEMSGPVDMEKISIQLAKLDNELKDNNFQAVHRFVELKSLLQALGLSNELLRIEQYIDTYAFKQARKELAAITDLVKSS